MQRLIAYAIRDIASVDDARRDRSVIRWSSYENAAHTQLAAYARMTDDELARELWRFSRGEYRSSAHQTQSRFKRGSVS